MHPNALRAVETPPTTSCPLGRERLNKASSGGTQRGPRRCLLWTVAAELVVLSKQCQSQREGERTAPAALRHRAPPFVLCRGDERPFNV